MRKQYRYILVVGLLISAAAFAEGKASSSSSKNTSTNKDFFFEVSGGTSSLNEYIASDHIEHPPAFVLAGYWHKSIFHIGVNYMNLYHQDYTGQASAGQAPNPAESDALENFTLTSLSGGIMLGDWLLLNGGYGYATFTRNESTPNSAPATSSSYKAYGTGWHVGGSIVPIHLGNRFSLGATGYYFDAAATGYSSDVTVGNVETTTANTGSVHSYGWYAGLALFLGI